MQDFLAGYHVSDPTWFYLSLLLILAVYFKFGRFWSLRNIDLILALTISPGILLVKGLRDSSFGYVWLFSVSGLILARLILDPILVRRPRLDQNLNTSGMVFLCCSALLFQTVRIFTEEPHASTVATVRQADDLIRREDKTLPEGVVGPEKPATAPAPSETGPASRLLATPVVPLAGGVEVMAARLLALGAHLAIVLAIIAVGRWHFSDTPLGIAMATLYLLIPCTAYDVSRASQLLPTALVMWSLAGYRAPIAAGILIGLACGTVFYPIFLLPIWFAFYWNRGGFRFTVALLSTGVVLLGSLLLTSADIHSFRQQTLGSIDWTVLSFSVGEGYGFWSLYDPAYRIPVFVVFNVMLICLTFWPGRKNLEHLISHSAAIIVGTQFWYPHQGGVYALWYLPLFLMAAFRPRLTHLLPLPANTRTEATPSSPSTPSIEPMRRETSPQQLDHTPHS